MRVTVPGDEIESEVDKRLKSMAGKVKIQGFRPGKAPFKVIKQKYGTEVLREVRGDKIQSSFYEALQQEKLNPASKPFIEPDEDSDSGQLEYTATFEIYPEFEITGLDKLKIERPTVEITDADVDKMLDSLRNQRKDWEEVDRAAEMGDQVIVSFVGTIDGEEFEGGTANHVDVDLGAKRMIPGLEEQLVGSKAGDQVNVKVTFPDDYPAKELAGKKAEFDTKVEKVNAAKLPELDDDFAASLDVKEGGVEALKKQVHDNLQSEAESTAKARVKARVFDALVDLKLFDVPKSLIDSETENLVKQRQQAMIQYGGAGRATDLDPADFVDEAQRRVSLGLILSEIVQKNDIKVSPTRLREEVEKMASSYNDPDQIVKHIYGNKDRLSEIESVTLEDLAVEWVLEQVQVKDKKTSFDELMNPGQTAK